MLITCMYATNIMIDIYIYIYTLQMHYTNQYDLDKH